MVHHSAVNMLSAMNALYRRDGEARQVRLGGRRLRILVTLIAALTPWLMAGMLWAS